MPAGRLKLSGGLFVLLPWPDPYIGERSLGQLTLDIAIRILCYKLRLNGMITYKKLCERLASEGLGMPVLIIKEVKIK